MEPILLDDVDLIPPTPEGPGDDGNGVFSFIYRGNKLQDIAELYGRENVCIKIFKNKETFHENYHQQWWGHSQKERGTLMHEAILIQNIYALEGLAPRVYDIFQVEIKGEKFWAHLTDDLGHWVTCEQYQDDLIKGPMAKVAGEYGFSIYNDGREYNVVGGKYVDFQGFHLDSDYKDRLKSRLVGVANVGKWGPWMNYHDIPELDIKGGRNNHKRVKQMGLDKIDFRDKTVLDIGCSEGFFCRYAADRGAKRVLGIDLPGVAKPAAELSYFLEYNNIDFLEMDLLKETPPAGQYDIVLFLAMVQHIGMPQWALDKTEGTFVFEGNGKDRDSEAIEKIKNTFIGFKEIGETDDLLKRRVVWGIR